MSAGNDMGEVASGGGAFEHPTAVIVTSVSKIEEATPADRRRNLHMGTTKLY